LHNIQKSADKKSSDINMH